MHCSDARNGIVSRWSKSFSGTPLSVDIFGHIIVFVRLARDIRVFFFGHMIRAHYVFSGTALLLHASVVYSALREGSRVGHPSFAPLLVYWGARGRGA